LRRRETVGELKERLEMVADIVKLVTVSVSSNTTVQHIPLAYMKGVFY